VNRSPVAIIAAAVIALTCCAGPASTTADPPSPGPASTSASPAPATTDHWCASYASLTRVLSASGTPSEAAQGLLALDRFSQLWKLAGSMGQTDSDHALLASSAGKVLGVCGHASPSASG
jgi:hypothetical protein